jgi:hypothetical protein
MDISDTLAPKSDQMDFEDVQSLERTFTITGVRKGPSAEQPVQFDLDCFDRPWRPSKGMRRVLVKAWGADASKYVGRQVTLFGDETVLWAGKPVGGIRIRALSHIEKRLEIPIATRKGAREPFIVLPIKAKDESGRDWLKELADTEGDADLILALGKAAASAHAAEPIVATIRQAYKDAKEPQ